MNVEHVNPFIEASTNVIRQTTGLNATMGKMCIKTTPYDANALHVYISLNGNVEGDVVISLDEESSCKLASAMMGGFEVSSMDDMTKSAIQELCNMILGNAATILSMKDMEVDITPPKILDGDNITVDSENKTICIPLEIDGSKYIELNLAI